MQLIRFLAAAAVAAIVIVLTPATSTARTYNVYGLGQNGAACDGWAGFNHLPSGYLQGQSCSPGGWYTEARSGKSFTAPQGAGFQMNAPRGTVFTGFAIDAEVTMNTSEGGPGMSWRQALCTTSKCSNQIVTDTSARRLRYRIGSVRSPSEAVRMTRAFAYLYCSRSSGCPALSRPGRLAFTTAWNSHVVVDDYTPPRPATLYGLSSGWNSGSKTLTYNAGDTGGGVERVNLSVDSGVTQTHVKSCHRVPGGGYKRPQPCRTASVVSSFPINGGSGRLNDGQHSLVTATVDAAGNISYARKSFKIDNHAPPAVGGLNVAGGQGWRRSRNFAIGWRNPAAGAGAPVSAVRYKLGRPPTNASDGTRVAGADISRLSLRMPSDGDRSLYVWVEDAAGNSDHRTARVVRLRGDTTAPTAAFQSSEDPANPREIRAALRERTSGIASATMEYRPLGSGTWRSLGSHREGGDLVATFPEDRVPRGTYELRARVRDRAGNATDARRRRDGRPMSIRSPLRPATVLSTGLVGKAAGRRGRVQRRRSIVVRYGRGATLRGRLATATGEPLSDAPLTVLARIPGQDGYRRVGRVVTGRSGGYTFRLEPGSSRRVVVTYAGGPALRSTSAGARLRVRASSTLRLTPRRLRVGKVLRFTGRVRSHVASAYGSEGKLVQVQFRDGRHWRPAVALTRTDDEGRFSIAYRFRRITRPTRIRFRVLVPREGGWPYATGRSRSRVVDVYPRR